MTSSEQTERFVGDWIRPDTGSISGADLARGEPWLPAAFRWKSETLRIASLLEKWKESGPCSSGGGERYVRKHWFRALDASGRELKIYMERGGPRSRPRNLRWRLFSMRAPSEPKASLPGMPSEPDRAEPANPAD